MISYFFVRNIKRLIIFSFLIIPFFTSASNQIKGVSLGEFSSCDYYLIEDSSGYYTLAEWYGGSTTYSGNTVVGELHSYGFKDLYNISRDSSTRAYIDDWMLSEDSATEKLIDKCGYHKEIKNYFDSSYIIYTPKSYYTPPTPIVPVPTILNNTLPNAIINKPYSTDVKFSSNVKEGVSMNFYEIPDGLSFSYISSNINYNSFSIKLTPRKSGNFTFKADTMFENKATSTTTFYLTVDTPNIEKVEYKTPVVSASVEPVVSVAKKESTILSKIKLPVKKEIKEEIKKTTKESTEIQNVDNNNNQIVEENTPVANPEPVKIKWHKKIFNGATNWFRRK